MTTVRATWNWSTFAGGAAQAVTRPIGVLIGAGGRMVFGLPVPAENLLAGALGSVTPSMLNDIAPAPAEPPSASAGPVLPGTDSTTGGPGPSVPDSGTADGVTGPPYGKSASPVESAAVEPPVTDPGVVEPPAVQLLRAVGITPGQDTAYAIAVRTGFVPTIGPAEFQDRE